MKTKRQSIMAILASMVVTFAVLIFATQGASLESLTKESNKKTVVIEPGSTPASIGQYLVEQQVIASAEDFSSHARSEGVSGSLQAGTYLLDSSMGVDEVVEIIAQGKVATSTITILPGSTIEDIKQVFISYSFTEKQVEDAFSAVQPRDYIDGVTAESLEGYIAPETYILGVDATVEDYLILALQQYGKALTPELLNGFTNQGLSVNGAAILASIVQLEADDPLIQPEISQVFIKRLAEGITLGSDVTFLYAAEQLGISPTVDLDSPYNTRINQGLPPTPIGNFNLSALESVAKPAPTDWLYFVAGDDGITYFSNTNAEHEALTAKHCIELCKL